MKPIKNLILDLGGVLIDIDFEKMLQSFTDLGVQHISELWTQNYSLPLFDEFETGKITPEVFYHTFRKKIGTPLTNTQIKNAWNAMLGSFRLASLAQLPLLKNKYRLFLFSNTNAIHYDCFTKKYLQTEGKANFNALFEKAYYSHDLNLRKPHPESYTKIIKEQHLIAAETLFIDDTLANIEGAKAAGLQVFHLIPPTTLETIGL